jgi:hypothetical protein
MYIKDYYTFKIGTYLNIAFTEKKVYFEEHQSFKYLTEEIQ